MVSPFPSGGRQAISCKEKRGGLVFEIEIESGVMSAPLPCLSGLAVTTDRSERKRTKTDVMSFWGVLHPISSEGKMWA